MPLSANLQRDWLIRSPFLKVLFWEYAFFGQFAKFYVVMIVQSIWKLYIPILFFDEECFKPKFKLLSLFWKFEVFNKFRIFKGVYRGSNIIFEQNKNYPEYQCISDHIFRGVLYKICKNDHISPLPIKDLFIILLLKTLK